MKKRILSLLLCLVLCCGLLPVTALATTEVPSVYVKIATPVEGQRPDYAPKAMLDKNFSESAVGYTFTDVKWKRYDETADRYVDITEDTVFLAGKRYIVEVTVKAADGYSLPSNMKAWFNEVAATTGGSAVSGGTDAQRVVTPSHYFVAEEAPKVTEIGLTVTAPVAGQKPTYTAGLVGDCFKLDTAREEPYVTGMFWNDVTADYTVVKPDETFQAGHVYQVILGVVPTDGRVFPTDAEGDATITAKVNDKEAGVFGDLLNLTVDYTFPAAEASLTTLEEVSVTVTAPKLGESPDYKVTVNTPGVHIDTSYQENGYVNGVVWGWAAEKDVNAATNTLKASDKFEEKKYYAVGVRLLPDDGYEFPASAKELNGFPVKFNGQNSTISNADQTALGAVYLFDALEAGIITSVSVTIDAPEIGGKPSFTAKVPEDANYTVEEGSVLWYDDAKSTALGAGDTFQDGKTYIFQVNLVPKEGYTFAEQSQITALLNGEPLSVNNGSDGKVWLKRYFVVGTQKENPFPDVVESDYFYDAVLWAYYAEPQVTNGVGDGLFGPDRTCTRNQVMTFLWRAAGCPAPKSSVNPFTDVPAQSWYTQAVLWAVEQGITVGIGDNKFGPGNTCSRSEVITFLYRAAGEPNKTGTGKWYDDAVNWANSNGLLTGTAQAFTPGANCPRKDIVLYLYRQLG